jgi:hypothetical protein
VLWAWEKSAPGLLQFSIKSLLLELCLRSDITGLFIHIPRIASEMLHIWYAVKTPLYIMNFKSFYKCKDTCAWQFKTATFVNTKLYHKQSKFQPFIYFISSSLHYFVFKIWYAGTITSIHVAPQYAWWNTPFLLLALVRSDKHVITRAGKQILCS